MQGFHNNAIGFMGLDSIPMYMPYIHHGEAYRGYTHMPYIMVEPLDHYQDKPEIHIIVGASFFQCKEHALPSGNIIIRDSSELLPLYNA